MTDLGVPEYVQIGLIRRAHGVTGEVTVEVTSDVPGRFDPGASCFLTLGSRRRRVRIESSRPHKGLLLVRFEACTDRDAAEELRGAMLEVDSSETPESAPGAYYYYELSGCRCHDRRAGDLGTVVDVIEDGGGLLLRVSNGRRTLLVPFVEGYIDRIVRGESIDFNLPPDLIEICGSSS